MLKLSTPEALKSISLFKADTLPGVYWRGLLGTCQLAEVFTVHHQVDPTLR